ncbi:MAG: rod shape-determining protein MreD [Janthinobacterium lividum]
MTLPPRKPFSAGLAPGRARLVPPATVVAGSLVGAWPAVSYGPLLPPVGLLLLLAWRLLAPGSLRIWAPAVLGFVDDLVSGQPLGSATMLWTLAALAVEAATGRTVFRSFPQDWLAAALAIAGVMIGGRLIAVPLSARGDLVLSAQIVAAILLFPAAARLCGWIDHRRHPA